VSGHVPDCHAYPYYLSGRFISSILAMHRILMKLFLFRYSIYLQRRSLYKDLTILIQVHNHISSKQPHTIRIWVDYLSEFYWMVSLLGRNGVGRSTTCKTIV